MPTARLSKERCFSVSLVLQACEKNVNSNGFDYRVESRNNKHKMRGETHERLER